MVVIGILVAAAVLLIVFLSHICRRTADGDTDELDDFAKDCGYTDDTEMRIAEEKIREGRD